MPECLPLRVANQEVAASRSQIATLNKGRGHNLKYRPTAFTEHGAIMAATVLNSARAAQMTIYVVRAFVKNAGIIDRAYAVGARAGHSQGPCGLARR